MKKTILLTIALSALLLASCATTKPNTQTEEIKMNYKGEVSYEEIYLPPPEDDFTARRCYLHISRSDGAAWWLDVTNSVTMGTQGKEAYEPKFEQDGSGFMLDFGKSGRQLFFKEMGGEPCLYKTESEGYPAFIITPPIPISELSAEKIGELLGIDLL